MRKFLTKTSALLIVVLAFAGSAFAQPTTGEINGAKVKKDFYTCSRSAEVIDLSYDMFGANYDQTKGKWEKWDMSTSAWVPASNIFASSDYGTGTFYLKYTATEAGFCNMAVNEYVIAVVTVLEDLSTITTVDTFLCKAATSPTMLSLSTDAWLKSKIPGLAGYVAAGYTLTFNPAPPFNNILNQGVLGTTTKVFPFVLTGAGTGACDLSGELTVRFHVQDEIVIPTQSRLVCVNTLTTATTTASLFPGVAAPGGVWAPATVPAAALTGPYPKATTFTYTWNKCSGGTASQTFTLNVTDDLSSLLAGSASSEICLSETQTYNLFTEYNNALSPQGSFNSTHGNWSFLYKQVGTGSTSTTGNPIIGSTNNISANALVTGVTYSFVIQFNESEENCGISGKKDTLKLTIAEKLSGRGDGRLTVCAGTTQTVDLNSLMGLPSNTVWTNFGGGTVTGGIVPAADLAGRGTKLYNYSIADNGCGSASGRFYLTKTDSIHFEANKVVNFCFLTMPSTISLDYLAGAVAGGTWAITTGTIPAGSLTGSTVNLASIYGANGYGGTYVFTLTGATDCQGNTIAPVTVTINITDQIVP